jgi:hypothetical protein
VTSIFKHIIPSKFKMLNRFLFMLFVSTIFFIGCKGDEEQNTEELQVTSNYSDGRYCADIIYYNPNTQRQSEYTLNVEVENGKLTKILWSNGGWLDVSHFTPPNVSASGDCSFTSDKGYQYTVSITGSECMTTDNPKAIEGREGNLTRKQYADLYGASSSLLNAFLKDRNVAADDVIDDEDCERMHKSLESFERLRNLEERISNGYIQKVVTRKNGYDVIVCQAMVVQRKNMYYIMEITRGAATMGLTSFDPEIDDWQEIKGVIVLARILYKSKNKAELDELAESFCTK